MKKLGILSFVNHIPLNLDINSILKKAEKLDIDYICSQGTGMDFGPYMLGSGKQFNVANFKNNVRPYIKFALKKKIKFIFSVGIAGGDSQLEECVNAINELAFEDNYKLKIAKISGEVSKTKLKSLINKGYKIKPAVKTKFLKNNIGINDIDESEHIVSQMGPEPIIEALNDDIDGIITGRALDIGLYMAPCMFHKFDKGLSAHLGKVLECAGLALTPGDPSEPIYGEISVDSIKVHSIGKKQKATIRSISSHSMYERDNPYMEKNPGGYLDIASAKYTQFNKNTVVATGAKWIEEPYTLKLEGAKIKGYRTISIFGIREPNFIDVLDDFIKQIRNNVKKSDQFKKYKDQKDYFISFDQYGKNGVYSNLEPQLSVKPNEIGLLVDVIASDQNLSENLAYYICMELWIKPYKNRLTTAGNCATRFAPPTISVGPAYHFNIWHLLSIDDPLYLFKKQIMNIPYEKN